MSIKLHRSRSARLTEEDLFPGDHIYVKRSTRFYKHHGIYMGDGKVIHVSGSVREKVSPEVRESDLSLFLKGKAPKKMQYHKRLPASETIRTAKKLLRDGSYSMVLNNCEHFAAYCATGKKKSMQVRKIVAGLSTAAAGVVIFALARNAFRR